MKLICGRCGGRRWGEEGEIKSDKRRGEAERGQEWTRRNNRKEKESLHVLSFYGYLYSCQSKKYDFWYENSSTTLQHLQWRVAVTTTFIVNDPKNFQRPYFISRVTRISAVPMTSYYRRLLALWRSRKKLTILVWSVSLYFDSLADWLSNVLTDWLTVWLSNW